MNFFAVFLLGLLINYSATFRNPSVNNPAFKNTADTLFLRKFVFDTVIAGKAYHIYNNVYIDNNRDSKHYTSLSDFLFTETENLDKYKEKMSKRNVKLSKLATQGLPAEWVPLYQYQNNYYVYMPSDPHNFRRRIISDSLLIFWFNDGPTPFPIRSITQKDPYTWTLRNDDLFVKMEGFIRPEILNIYIIDPKTNMSVWEYKSGNEKTYSYELCIPKEHSKDFPVVVNESNERADEFEFEQPDFKKILKKRPGK